MLDLDTVSLEELQTILDKVDEMVPTQRVLTAIGRKLNVSTDTLAEMNTVSEQPIRNWLNRFKDQPISQARYDDSRSGRPPKLTDEEKFKFFADLSESPEEVGNERQVWFPALAYRHLKETYGVEYSPSQIYRLLHKAGPAWRRARPRHYEADSEAEAEFSVPIFSTHSLKTAGQKTSVKTYKYHYIRSRYSVSTPASTACWITADSSIS